jgi:hypothetical protein
MKRIRASETYSIVVGPVQQRSDSCEIGADLVIVIALGACAAYEMPIRGLARGKEEGFAPWYKVRF